MIINKKVGIDLVFTLESIENRVQNQDFDDLTTLKLNVDAYRLALKHKFDPVSAVSIGKIDPLPHQVDAFLKIMAMLRPQTGIDGKIRMLLADDVGLGKTIMVGLVMKELLIRQKIERVLIVCPSGLQIQWKEELQDKFNEDFTIIKGSIKDNQNPYEEIDKAIISVDTGRNETKAELLLSTSWDLVIFDEAHKLKPNNKRYDLASEICESTKHLILASATPHDGKVENFLGLVKLIDSELENNVDTSELQSYLDPLMIRRLKEDIVNFKGKKIFPARKNPDTIQIEYSPEELDFYNSVEEYVKEYYKKAEDSNDALAVLALYILNRRVSSSIEAGVRSLEKRKDRLLEPYIDNETELYITAVDDNDAEEIEENEDVYIGATTSQTPVELEEEINKLEEIIQMGKNLQNNGKDTKYARLLLTLETIRKERPDDKIIIFTEFTDTLLFLEENLTKEGFLIAKIRGGMSPEDKKEQSRIFEKRANLLLGTEAAGEGLNLQFANIVINYELPWNPNRLEQRIGRVYRYGQKKEVFIYNFKTAFQIDNAVLAKILEKMENIRAIFGDTAIDVIGSLISEKDVINIFKVSMSTGTGVNVVEQLFEEKTKVFEQISHFFIKEKFNISNLSWMADDTCHSVNNFDVERFMLTYTEKNPDIQIMPDSASKSKYNIYIPGKQFSGEVNCIDYIDNKYKTLEVSGVFDPNEKGTYISLGHPAVNYALDDLIRTNSISIVKSSNKGIILTYIIRFYNELGKEIYAEPIILLKTCDGTEILDSMWIWNMESFDTGIKLQIDYSDYSSLIEESFTDVEIDLSNKISEIEKYVYKKNENDIETEFNFILAESDWKVKNQNKKKQIYIEKGQNYLLPEVDSAIKKLKNELKETYANKDKAKRIGSKICGPINVAFLVPEIEVVQNGKAPISPEKFIQIQQRKREVELAGMEYVAKYEKDHGRNPQDVSHEMYRGYDILSKSSTETRYIEVKSFSTTNPIEISSNEWRMASHYGENYYLYVVQNTSNTPELFVIQDPFVNLKDYVFIKEITDFKIVLSGLNDDIKVLSE